MYGINKLIFATVWCGAGLLVGGDGIVAVFLWQFVPVAVLVYLCSVIVVGLVGAKVLAASGKGLDVGLPLAWVCKYSFIARHSVCSVHHSGVTVVSFDRP